MEKHFYMPKENYLVVYQIYMRLLTLIFYSKSLDYLLEA